MSDQTYPALFDHKGNVVARMHPEFSMDRGGYLCPLIGSSLCPDMDECQAEYEDCFAPDEFGAPNGKLIQDAIRPPACLDTFPPVGPCDNCNGHGVVNDDEICPDCQGRKWRVKP